MSVAILTDTNSGFSEAEAKEAGIFLLPMPFYIDEKLYYESKDLTQEKFHELQAAGHEIHTSMPLMGDVMDKWESILKDYDELVYIPMSSGLSGSCEAAVMLAKEEEFAGRVFVVDNQRISVTMKLSALEAKKLAERGKSGKEIRRYLEMHKKESSIYIMVDTLRFLKKGGRITPTAAAIGTLLRIKPVLQIQGEKLDKFAMARTMKQAKQIMLDAIARDMKERFSDPSGEGCVISIAHTQNAASAEEIIFTSGATAGIGGVIGCHTGPGTLAITTTKSFLS